jgi:hypothetical protein
LSEHGSISACKKPIWKKRKPRDTPHAWLRRLICPFDFGLKVKTIDPETGKASSHPIHCNRNRDVLAALRDKRRWRYVASLTNGMLDAHWNGDETFYFAGAGSSRRRHILVNFDIDCHASGSPEGAFEAAEYLRENFFPNLYHEPSTNGRGRHCYFILEKCGINAEGVKELLKALEKHLNQHLLSAGFDIELFEIKGLPPVVTWGDDGTATNYTAGVLAKIPRHVHRFEEWKRTTVLTDWDVRKLITRLRPTTPAEVSITPKRALVKPLVVETPGATTEKAIGEVKATGSTAGKVIGQDDLAQLADGGHYRNVAATLLGTHTLKTSGRTVVMIEDVAIFLLCLKFFTERMNADGTLPVKRFDGLWSALNEAGDVGRSFDCHRFKAIRDYLSDLGLLDWEDNTFIAPRFDHSGTRRNGRACKWKASEVLMGMLDWEKWEGEGREVQVVDNQDKREGEGEAPFVGTKPSTPPPPACIKLIEMIRSLNWVPEDEKTRPIEVVSAAQSHPRSYTPEEVTRMVLSFEESMERLAA